MIPVDLDIQSWLMQERLNQIKNPVRPSELPPIVLQLADAPGDY